MSLHETWLVDSASKSRAFYEMAKQQGASFALTTSVPPESYARMEAEVMALKPQKRKNYKGSLVNSAGQRTRVRYVEAGIKVPGRNFMSHFENKVSGQKQAQFATDLEWRTVIPIGLPLVDIEDVDYCLHMRRERDVKRDSMPSQEQSMDLAAEARGNRTGNHGPRNHPIRVPTAAGAPVRG